MKTTCQFGLLVQAALAFAVVQLGACSVEPEHADTNDPSEIEESESALVSIPIEPVDPVDPVDPAFGEPLIPRNGGAGEPCNIYEPLCNPGLTCNANNICRRCGNFGQRCCVGGACNSGLECDSFSNTCSFPMACGEIGQSCCNGNQCNQGACVGGSCRCIGICPL